ncbi:protein SOGA3a [Scomber scombrus]|uniref:protein SOGA3a n=1 Tax=Scomber scombrus TaxID=13677 RepID=UPI002DD99F18|nr:protein SOGA3a [Scomber scombrus]
MWTAFMNGSGLHGGGDAGGGYVQSQGWEFVPCSGMERKDRGRGNSRSPLRRISSPPTVFSQLYETQFGTSPGAGEGGAATQLEVLRGQMWQGPELQQQQPTHHTRLRKKFDDLKKRHVQDKQEWMREKESLLREVADIQGGENRRILLDLKTVLEEVQVEVKREEEKRSELQLQYTRDRCAWEVEKAELQCRIAQLEARERAELVSGRVQTAAGPGSVASRSNREQRGETSTLRREREEQRRLLADTHSTAMDLRCRLDHNERDWSREKAELLERFDVERKEWESQLKDMQKKIEELYCEVRAKREETGLDTERQDEHNVVHRLSMRSTSTGSSLLSDNSHSQPLSSSSQSELSRHPPLPGFGCNSNISGSGGRDSQQSSCFQADNHCDFNVSGQFTQNDHVHAELLDELRSRGPWKQVTDIREAVDTLELEAIFHGAIGCGVVQKNGSEGNERNVHVDSQESLLWEELSFSSTRKKNTTALNAALKEIARVSEELCSYQDEIRKKSVDKRNQSDSLCLPEEREMLPGHDKTRQELDESPCDLSQIYDDLRALGRENWITLSPDNTWQADRGPDESWRMSATDPDSYRDTQTSPGVLSEMDIPAPPIPPRTSSWNLSSPTDPDTELHIPESPMATVRKCHSPCVLVDRKCSSPSIVRKFGAMLQENEGKVLIDGKVASCAVPVNSNCNVGCCHSRWSCDASKFINSKLSAYGTVQKSFSEVNILDAGKDSDYSPGVGNIQSPELQIPPFVKDLPVELLLSSLEITPASSNIQGSRRNIMLEQKTAEFNRTLFQAEMGRGVDEQDSFTVTDACSLGCQPDLSAAYASDEVLLPRESKFQPHFTDVTASVTGIHPEVTLSLPTLDSPIQNPEVQPRRGRCGTEAQKVRVRQEIPSGLSPEQPQAGLREASTSQSPAHHSEVKHKLRTASSPSRKTHHRAVTEAPFSEPALPANTQPGQNVERSSSKNENPHGAKPQPARVGVSLQQPSAENKQRQMTQPGHQAQPKHASVPLSQSDSSRPGPRMMNDHPWKPLTLAAYPRPEGSRSNYGAVERILKNYESAARAQQNHSLQSEMTASPNVSVKQEENATELDMLDIHPLLLPPTLRHTHSHGVMGVTEIQLAVQLRWECCLFLEKDKSCFSSSSIQKNFSRPARPANRRLPSRWASRSPTSSSSTSSSPSTTPVVPPSFPLQKHTSSFTYSHAFHIETVII